MGKRDKGDKRYKLLVIKSISHGDVKYGMGNVVNKIVMYGDR